jgi:hypothetical protein
VRVLREEEEEEVRWWVWKTKRDEGNEGVAER